MRGSKDQVSHSVQNIYDEQESISRRRENREIALLVRQELIAQTQNKQK